MNHTFTSQRHSHTKTASTRERGIVLPVALIMLAIVSFAGLMAAKNSASSEQFSNNLRTSQVARQGAEAALRYCERVAMNSVATTPETNTELHDLAENIPAEKLANLEVASIEAGAWNNISNWATDGANLITVPLNDDLVEDPYCLIEPAEGNQFLITARGLSRNAQIEEDGQLSSGAEVWLQSILTRSRPVGSPSASGPL